jgi:replicative DNA helicase
MALSQMAAVGLEEGLTTAVATLEVSEAIWMARAMAAITRVPTTDILTKQHRDVLISRLEDKHPILGDLSIKYFQAKMATAIDIERWVDSIEQKKGKKVELLVVDYVDKLASHNKQDQGEYASQGTAAERLRVFAEARSMWSYTASQAIRRAGGDRKRKLDMNDGADSQHKVRIADMVITLNPADEDLIYRVVKWRLGKGNFESSPIPTAFYCGRLAE